ncbi:MAG: nitroreductase family deazaflavin-dependent oxidoreductase [Acidimicrobiales bacterium]
MSDERSSKQQAAKATNDWNSSIIEEFRANHGVLGGNFAGAPVLLLHTKGARSGAARVNPMMYLEEDGTLYVFASKAGADSNPDWFYNLVATPSVSVEVGTETFDALATPLDGTEHDRIYALHASRYPAFAEYQAKTSRVIPVVKLDRN